jgi:hypothetical protein
MTDFLAERIRARHQVLNDVCSDDRDWQTDYSGRSR